MADIILLHAYKGQAKSVNLSNKKLCNVPSLIGKLSNLKTLDLKNNRISSLPPEFAAVAQLENLNLGSNLFEDFPVELTSLCNLRKLHLFSNKITKISSLLVASLHHLTFLNLNNNKLTSLPPDIDRLVSLECLSASNNQISHVPDEICHLTQLTTIDFSTNEIESLPENISFLRNLRKLILFRNKIVELPEGLTKCTKLETLDISCNCLRVFPVELAHLPLKELYCEGNSLLQHIPVHSEQEDEVLPLKEISCRFVLKAIKQKDSFLRVKLRYFPKIKELLTNAMECPVCNESFLNTWLECVRFVDCKKGLRTQNSPGVIPIRGLLCSYKCFNVEGHDYFGVAQVSNEK